MSDLSPRAQELIARASTGGGPTEAQRKAVKRGAMAAVVASTLAAAATTKFLIIGLAIGVAGGGLAVTVLRAPPTQLAHVPPPASSEPPPSVSEPKAQPQVLALAPEPKEPQRAEPAEKLKGTSSVRREAHPPPAAPLPISSLATELAALDRAVRSIDAAQFEQGLGEAREFLRTFPDSELAIEARVVEVLALCGLSRTDEAQTIVTHFSVESRNNPAVRRLSNSCVELAP